MCRRHVRDLPAREINGAGWIVYLAWIFFLETSAFFFCCRLSLILVCSPCPSIERWIWRDIVVVKNPLSIRSSLPTHFSTVSGWKLRTFAFFPSYVGCWFTLWSTAWVKPHNIPQDIWLCVFFLQCRSFALPFDFNWRFYDSPLVAAVTRHVSITTHNGTFVQAAIFVHKVLVFRVFHSGVLSGAMWMNVKWTITRWLEFLECYIHSGLESNNVINAEYCENDNTSKVDLEAGEREEQRQLVLHLKLLQLCAQCHFTSWRINSNLKSCHQQCPHHRECNHNFLSNYLHLSAVVFDSVTQHVSLTLDNFQPQNETQFVQIFDEMWILCVKVWEWWEGGRKLSANVKCVRTIINIVQLNQWTHNIGNRVTIRKRHFTFESGRRRECRIVQKVIIIVNLGHFQSTHKIPVPGHALSSLGFAVALSTLSCCLMWNVKCKTEFLSFASTQLEIPFTIMKIAEILAFRTLCLLVLTRTTLHYHETHAINIMAKLIFICKIISSLAIEKIDRGSWKLS